MKKISLLLRRRMTALTLTGAVAIAASSLAFTHARETNHRAEVNVPVDETPVSREGLPRGSFAPIVKRVVPGVVKIESTIPIKNPAMNQFPGFNDPFWRRFFGDQFGRQFPQHPGNQVEHGLGSGVIVTKDGYILTNNHVVDGARELKVTLPDGRDFKATVIGRDPKSDIAVIKIDASDLPVVPFADSSKVEVGDVVLAVGNPFGVGQTVTHGIVSATDRGNMGIEDYEDFIQTDAAINPGNSGGALVDIEGRLIGINTAILSRSGGSQGVGFAIPSNLARSVMESLIKTGHVTRGYLGVSIQNVTPDLAREFGLKESGGALVGGVIPDGPADKAGIESGDVILEFNHHKVTDSRHLQLEVAQTRPGTKVPVEIWHDGNTKTVEVRVKQLSGNEEMAQNGSENESDNGTLNGVTVSDLDQQARDQFHIPDSVKGAIVVQVDPNCAAAAAGLRPGAVIQSINRQQVTNADEAVKLTEHPKSKRTLLLVWDNGGSHYIVVDETQDSNSDSDSDSN